MQAIIFMGIQGSGKTTFYAAHLLKTHLRISLDMLKTRNKERKFMELCLATGQKFVVDNTNATEKERAVYIEAAKAYKFKVTGYFFHSSLAEAIARNALRPAKEIVPVKGIGATYKKLEMPSLQEGFDELFVVKIENNQFVITKKEE